MGWAAAVTLYRMMPDESDKKCRVPPVGEAGSAVILWLVLGVAVGEQVALPPLGVTANKYPDLAPLARRSSSNPTTTASGSTATTRIRGTSSTSTRTGFISTGTDRRTGTRIGARPSARMAPAVGRASLQPQLLYLSPAPRASRRHGRKSP